MIHMCFACGRDNPISLDMKFFLDEDKRYCCRFVAKPEHVGYGGMMHGGLVATLLDECLARVVIEEGFMSVTAELNVKYLKPTPVGEELLIRAWIERGRGKLFFVAGDITAANGEVTAKATAKIMALREEVFQDESVQPDRSRWLAARQTAT